MTKTGPMLVQLASEDVSEGNAVRVFVDQIGWVEISNISYDLDDGVAVITCKGSEVRYLSFDVVRLIGVETVASG